MTNNSTLIDALDKLLPQTQCGECDFDGCRPYAEAMVNNNEPIDKCIPGGTCTLRSIGALLNKDIKPFLSTMQEKEKPPMLAVIREEECIGCTKCIQACPTDAILGSGKLMHTVITDACTGCELCVEPCPVDCIDMLTLPKRTSEEKHNNANNWRARYESRNARLAREDNEKTQQHQRAKLDERRTAIQAAIARAKARKAAQ